MNSSAEPTAAKKVNLTVAGKTVQAREGETIIHALWQAGPSLWETQLENKKALNIPIPMEEVTGQDRAF